MTEALSGTTAFNLPVDEIIEEAFDHIKKDGENVSGYGARSARRSLNMLLQDMINRGYPWLQMEERTLTLVDGTNYYELASDVIGLLDVNYVDADNVESQMTRKSIFDFFNISNKDTEQAHISVYAYDRSTSPSKIYVWPTPNADSNELKYWAIKAPNSITASYQLVDITSRYLPAVSVGLAYFMALKKEGFPLERLNKLETEYMNRLQRAFDEDSERVDIYVYPDTGTF